MVVTIDYGFYIAELANCGPAHGELGGSRVVRRILTWAIAQLSYYPTAQLNYNKP